jgi:protein-export membrane protein SecD
MGRSEDDQQEAQDLALTLRYGSLPVAFEVSSVTRVSATLGEDSLEAGIIAGLIGLALVAVWLLFIYRSLAMVTIVGLTIFGSLLITLFGVLGRMQGLTLTLASVTGIIVAIGITADSDIVYFERIKDKVREGLPVDQAAEEGFSLAFRTILTADTVSLLGAILLWVLAVGAVKGFAMALGLANILDIFIFRTYTRRAVATMAESRFAEGGRFSVTGAAS